MTIEQWIGVLVVAGGAMLWGWAILKASSKEPPGMENDEQSKPNENKRNFRDVDDIMG